MSDYIFKLKWEKQIYPGPCLKLDEVYGFSVSLIPSLNLIFTADGGATGGIWVSFGRTESKRFQSFRQAERWIYQKLLNGHSTAKKEMKNAAKKLRIEVPHAAP